MKFFRHIKRNVMAVWIMGALLVAHSASAAGGFGSSKYATGTASLVNDIFFWLTVTIIPATAALMIAYESWKKKVADGDGQAILQANKRIKTILIAAIVGETASTLVTLITGYYK